MHQVIKKAFTLIELLVVIAIIGILSGLIVVSMGGMTDKATIAKAQIFSNSLRNSLMLNTVGQWTFDDITDYDTGTKVVNSTGGNIPDSWGSNEGRAYAGPILSTACVSGYCLSFDGVDDYINYGAGSNLNMRGAITISFWVNPLTYNFTDVAAFIIGNGISSQYGYHVWLWKGGYIEYRTCQSGAQQGTTSLSGYIPQNTWTHVAITRSGANALVYINGVDRTNFKASHIDPASSLAATYSGRYTSANYFVKGLLDEIRLYDNVMSISQIRQQYFSGLNSLLANSNINKEEYGERINSIASNE